MSSLDVNQPSSAAPKKALPFKKRKSSSATASTATPSRKSASKDDAEEEDDGLKLFKRSGNFFEERTKKSAEMAQKSAKREKERKVKQEKQEKKMNSEASAQLLRESVEMSSPAKSRREDSVKRESKRRLVSNSMSDDGKDDDDEAIYTSQRSPRTPPTTRNSLRSSHDRTPVQSLRRGLSKKARQVEVISLDDSDDEDLTKPPIISSKANMQAEMAAEDSGLSSADIDLDPIPTNDPQDDEDPVIAKYVKSALEHAEANKAERLLNENALAQILIQPRMQHVKPFSVTLKLSQQISLVRQAWIARVSNKETTPYSAADMKAMFFTWKGMKVYDFATLIDLGIKRPDTDGRFYPTWEGEKDGYKGWDKVLFEAWTPELYEEYNMQKEKERKRALGELDDDLENETEPQQAEEPAVVKIRLTLKSKDLGELKLTVTPEIYIQKLLDAFRSKKSVPASSAVQIYFEGQRLEPGSTIEDADISDMDLVEVHVK